MEARYLNASKRMKQFNKNNSKMLKLAKHGKDVDDHNGEILHYYGFMNYTQKELAEKLGFSKTTIQRKIQRMGIQKKVWEHWEVSILERVYYGFEKEGILGILNKTWKQIMKKAQHLKFKRHLKFKYDGMIKNTLNNNPMTYPEVRLKQSKRIKELIRNNPKRALNYRLRRNKKTKIEIIFENILDSLGYVEGKDYFFNNYMKTKASYKFPDFLFPKQKIVFEVDGLFWHKNKEKEDLRDEEIKERGYQIYHFTDKELLDKKGEEKIKCIIQKLLKQ